MKAPLPELKRRGSSRLKAWQKEAVKSPTHHRLNDSLSLFGGSTGNVSAVDEARIQRCIEDELLEQMDHSPFQLSDILPLVADGAQVTVEDDFSRCFRESEPDPWNWNAYLWVLWSVGVLVRYLVLFPLRLVILLACWVLFALLFALCTYVLPLGTSTRHTIQRALIRYLCSAFVLSWTGVIKYHGILPSQRSNQIYVANHSSMIDLIVLEQMHSFAVVGQKHKGWIGFLQDHVLACLGCVWFNRGESKDRKKSAERIKNYITNQIDNEGRPKPAEQAGELNNRLLIFPEGTCVNNRYVVQFKKGAFDMGATVCPIAIKYNSIFVDGYWNSRRQSFLMHLVNLMTSWAVVCDVWFLEPQQRRWDESAIDFAKRVQVLIAKRAGLTPVDWDGYMKYFRPSARYVQRQQRLFADRILARFLEAGDELLKDSASAAAHYDDHPPLEEEEETVKKEL